MKKLSEQPTQLINSLGYKGSSPLWQRVPTKDDQGKLLADFMIIIPKLNKQPSHIISRTSELLAPKGGELPKDKSLRAFYPLRI